MAAKKTRRHPTSRKPISRKKANGSAFPAMSDVLKAIEDNFRALAAMMPTGGGAKPKRKPAAKRKAAAKRGAARTKTAIKRAAAKARRALPKRASASRRRRNDKRPSATAPV